MLPFGHSHALDTNDSNADGDTLFGTAAQLSSVVTQLTNQGSEEQVWDAIEHTIAEYEFRPGAAVIFVAFRRDDLGGGGNYVGNVPEDESLQPQTREGTLAEMKSYNVTFNVVTATMFDPAMYAASGGIVLGVEADRADWVEDGRQIAHVVNGVANQPTSPDVLLISRNGTSSGTYLGGIGLLPSLKGGRRLRVGRA